MANRNVKPSEINGLFIYHDAKNRTIFHDPLTRNAYVITNSDVKTYILYTSLLPACIIITFFLTSVFSFDYLRGFLFFVALYLIGEVAFRLIYFKNFSRIENWKPYRKDNVVVALAKNYSNVRLILMCVMLLALTILIPINAIMTNVKQLDLYLSYGLSVITGIGSLLAFIAIFVKKNNNY